MAELQTMMCEAHTTLIEGLVEFVPEADASFVYGMEITISRGRHFGCGAEVIESAGSVALRCAKVATGECPLLEVGLSNVSLANKLGVPVRRHREDFDFVA